jgi:hypothetical protein
MEFWSVNVAPRYLNSSTLSMDLLSVFTPWPRSAFRSRDITMYIQVIHYGIWPWRRILNGACISISNLPENIAWQTHKDDLRPETRGPLKSGAWGGRPTCHPQTPAMAASLISYAQVWLRAHCMSGCAKRWEHRPHITCLKSWLPIVLQEIYVLQLVATKDTNSWMIN